MAGRLKQSLAGVSLVAGLFLLVMGFLCARDAWRLAFRDPLLSPALTEARKASLASPGDGVLRKRVVELDAAARREHFLLRRRVRRAAALLAVAAFVLAGALRWSSGIARGKPKVERGPIPKEPPEDPVKARSLVLGGSLWGLAGIFLFAALWRLGEVPEVSPPAGDGGADESIAPLREATPVWPAFRGPSGSSKALYARFAWKGEVEPEVSWIAKIPRPGYSSPIIVGDMVYLTGGGKSAREVYCFSARSGELVWRKVVPFFATKGAKLPKPSDDTGFAASTMASDGKRVFAVFATGDIAAFSLDGQPLWRMNPGVPDNHYAYSSSLAVADGKVLVQIDNASSGVFMALDAATGEVAWKAERKDSISWASPTVAEAAERGKAGRLTAFLASSLTVTAYDVASGDLLWRTECLSGEVAPSPAYESGRVFVANDNAAAVALDAASGKVLWSIDDVDLPDVSSPLATPSGRVYLAASFGTLTCLDAENGKTLWTSDFDEGFYASPILVGDGLICLLDLKGNMFLIRDSAEGMELVAKAALSGDTQATPAFAENAVFVRRGNELLKIDIAETASPNR